MDSVNNSNVSKLTQIYEEVIAGHYYRDGINYCSDLLNIPVEQVRRIRQGVFGRKIIHLVNQGLCNDEIAYAIGVTPQKAKRLIKTALDNEGDLRRWI